ATTDVLDQRVAQRRALAMLHLEGTDLVVLAAHDGARLEVRHREREGQLLVPDAFGTLEQRLRATRAPDAERGLAELQRERLQQAQRTEEVIGVEVREEQILEREAHAVAHHLALRAFAAVEHQRLALAQQRDGGEATFDGGTRS